MKKFFVTACVCLLICMLAACGEPGNSQGGEKPTVVCTGFAQYDWVRNLLGDEAEEWNIIRINDKGTDMHSYQPTTQDIVTITNCDLILYTGGISEEWVEDIIKDDTSFSGKVYELLEHGEIKMVEEHEGHSHNEEDEHIWLSLDDAIKFCDEIAQLLSAIDEEHSEEYEANCKEYERKLKDLDEKYETFISEASKKVVVFADRFPFRYLMEDYGLTYFAAFPGCSAETEASFETIVFLADKLDEYDLDYLVITEGGDESIAETVIKNSRKKDTKILRMNSMQSVSSKDTELSYIAIAESNLQVLQEALS